MRTLFFCFLLGTFVPSFAQSADTVSFTLTPQNNIALPAVLNQTDRLLLMLHTAASDMTLIESAAKKLTTISWTHEDSVGSWGGSQTARYSLYNDLQIGEKGWDSLIVWENQYSGPGTEGKVGLSMLKAFFVELNFDRNELVLHEQLPEWTAQMAQLPLQMQGSLLFVTLPIQLPDTQLVHSFLVHSGYSGAVLLDDEFAAQHQLAEQLPILNESILKDSYGNELLTLESKLPGLVLGGISLEEVPVGFFGGSINRQKMSVIGGDLLKRYNLIFDLENGMLYAEPNGLQAVAYWER